MLSLTKKTEYALIALSYLAERPDQTISAREIAENFGMPGALVMNILKTLHHAEMLSSTRGTKGGYRLTADLSRVSVHELVGILEGPIRLVECALEAEPGETRQCRIGPGNCPIQAPVHGLHAQMVKFLSDVKLSDVINGRNGHAAAHPVGA
jgi:Rrf2 family transcriptional regulator, nitric oxide-sensitive transcriptional repressor